MTWCAGQVLRKCNELTGRKVGRTTHTQHTLLRGCVCVRSVPYGNLTSAAHMFTIFYAGFLVCVRMCAEICAERFLKSRAAHVCGVPPVVKAGAEYPTVGRGQAAAGTAGPGRSSSLRSTPSTRWRFD
jgi:hypothetical protein